MKTFSERRSTVVMNVTTSMLEWLDDEDIQHYIEPNIIIEKHVLLPKSHSLKKDGPRPWPRTDGNKITFENEKDKLYFDIRWADFIKK